MKSAEGEFLLLICILLIWIDTSGSKFPDYKNALAELENLSGHLTYRYFADLSRSAFLFRSAVVNAAVPLISANTAKCTTAKWSPVAGT